jgi:chromosome segregation ATPase
MSQIQTCERQIQDSEDEIFELTKKIESQDGVRRAFQRQAQDYEDEIQCFERKAKNIESISDEMRYARKAGGVMNDHMSKRGTNDSRLDEILSEMRREILAGEEKLSITERTLSDLQTQLASLKTAYEDALRREAEEAAAAAGMRGKHGR